MEQHALVLPLPSQSHVNAIFNFAQLLSSRGFIITFVTTDHIHKHIFKSTEDVDAAIERLRKQGLRFHFDFVADGLPTDHGRQWDQLLPVLQSWAPALEEFVSKVEKKGPPLTCIVADAFMSTSAHHLALKLRLPRVVFWPTCAAASVTLCHTRLLISKGYLPFKSGVATNGIITCLPGIPPVLRAADLPLSRVREEIYRFSVRESDFQDKGDFVAVNSFEELEGAEAMRGLSMNCLALSVGPVFVGHEGQFSRSHTLTELSLWTKDRECVGWLDKHSPASVLYVSFGSVVVLSTAQVQELALGLEASGHPFLWAMRSVSVQGISAHLPEGFGERTRDRGLFVEWCPQREVLAHRSVGGFLTHNGWNSTLESISSGVAMIGWPVLADQFLNCRLMKDVWQVGLSFGERAEGELVRKEEVEKLVRCLMEGGEGKVVRDNVKRLQRLTVNAAMPGGSSSTNIDMLVQGLRKTHYRTAFNIPEFMYLNKLISVPTF